MKKLIIGAVVLAVLVVGLLWLQGIFDPSKVGPGTRVRDPERAGDRKTAEVESVTVPEVVQSVGTVRSRRTTRVSPRVMGTLLEITVNQGSEVSEGQVLARIDVREAEARLAAARANLAQAEAVFQRASADHRRYTELFEKGATTQERMEAATADHESAKATVDAARETVRAAEIVVGYAEIRAPLSGVVAEKLAEPGDLALPGKPILTIQDPKNLRLEADVREYLGDRVTVGSTVVVTFDAPLSERHETVIEERAPEADPRTRTFRVKAGLPAETRARPGNFGRLRLTVGERTMLRIPAAAVRRIGQLETVRVLEDDRVLVRHVRTGKVLGDAVEVLSGLSAGEKVVVD
jgi:RND family efflux transporter MFP subunit